MAKTMLDRLMEVLSPEEQAAVRAKIEANPTLKVTDSLAGDLLAIYGEPGEDDTAAQAAKAAEAAKTAEAAKVEAARAAAVRAAEAAKTTSASVVQATDTGDSAAILEKLNALSTTLDTRFADFEKKVVTIDKLPTYRTDMIGATIKATDDYAQVREDHRAEFGERLDRAAFEKFIMDHTPKEMAADGVTVARLGKSPYKDMQEAHDAFVAEKRTQKKIDTGIAEGIKQKQSGTLAPGQTPTSALSPAQQAVAKQKADAAGKGGDGKNNAMIAAEKLAKLRQAREDRESAIN